MNRRDVLWTGAAAATLLGGIGALWRTGSPELRTRQELMRAEGPDFVDELMDELRARHLGAVPRPHDGPGPSERLAAAYAAATGAHVPAVR